MTDPTFKRPACDRPRAKTRARRARLVRSRRGGALLVTVLSVGVIVSILALASALVVRMHAHQSRMRSDRYHSRLLAYSAIENALTEFNTNPDWRTDYAFDTEYPSPPVDLGYGTFTWSLVDLGGGQRQLDGIGRSGGATCVISVNLGSDGAGALTTAMTGALDVTVGLLGGEHLSASGAPVCSNGTLTNHATIDADVEAQLIVNLGTINGSQTILSGFRQMPDANQVFSYYQANGTVIPAGLITDGSTLSLDGVLLSPASNPFGAPDPDGIYVIDAQGMTVTIEQCRIVGTLVVVNSLLASVEVGKAVCWEPARPNYPALLAEGNVRIRMTAGLLSESGALANFNPVGTPFQTETDNEQSDDYPNAIAGLIYAGGSLTFDGNMASDPQTIEGVVISAGVVIVERGAQVSLTYDSIFSNDPPPGFVPYSPAQPVPGTWRQSDSP